MGSIAGATGVGIPPAARHGSTNAEQFRYLHADRIRQMTGIGGQVLHDIIA
jgi:hypothetical protein